MILSGVQLAGFDFELFSQIKNVINRFRGTLTLLEIDRKPDFLQTTDKGCDKSLHELFEDNIYN